jgi:hypothetical protein
MATKFELDKQAAANAAQVDANQTLFTQWLGKHPEVPDCTAVRNLFQEYMDFTDPLSVADFDFAYGNLESSLRKQRVATEAEIKQELIGKICELIASKNGGRDGKFSTIGNAASPSELERERKRISFWTVEALTKRLEEVVRAQRLSKFSAGELREHLSQHRAAQQPGRVVLPTEYTRERIHAMSSHEIKKLIRDWTVTVVNDRLFGRS